MINRSIHSVLKSNLSKLVLITVLLLAGATFTEIVYSSHDNKLSKKELWEKHKFRLQLFDDWEPKIRIRPSDNPRALHHSSKPLPKSIAKQIKRSAIYSMFYFDGQSVVYDWKKDDLSDDRPIYGQSMSKSITSYLVGAAYCQGRIKSLNDTIGQYTDSFDGSFYENVQIIDALDMASGDGNLYPKSKQGASRWKYYVLPVVLDRVTIKQAIQNLGNKKPTKKKFNYTNPNTDVLSAVLVSVADEGFSEFAAVHLTDPAGFRYDSYFLADHDGIPHGFAYFWAARSDWLRAAIKIGEDYHSDECIGEYLRSAVEDTVKTGKKFQGDHTRYGKQFWSRGVLKKFPHIAMKGHGGTRGYIGTATPPRSPEVIMIHSVRADYKETDFLKKILK